jgi:hypothetical protein
VGVGERRRLGCASPRPPGFVSSLFARMRSLRPLTTSLGVAKGDQRSDAGASLRKAHSRALEEAVFCQPRVTREVGEVVTEGFTTRRGPAAAGLIPVRSMCPGPLGHRARVQSGATSCGSRHVIPTHEYQSGGSPIHAVPARRRVLGARPPPRSETEIPPVCTYTSAALARTLRRATPSLPLCCSFTPPVTSVGASRTQDTSEGGLTGRSIPAPWRRRQRRQTPCGG